MPETDQTAPPPLETPLVQIALPIGLDRTFTYAVPDALRGRLFVGQRVRVPFGPKNRKQVGWVVGGVETTDLKQVKQVAETVDDKPLLSQDLVDLAFWMSRYYVTPIGQVFEGILPAAVKRRAGFRTVQLVVRTEKPESEAGRILSKQRRVLDLLAEGSTALAPRELARQAGCTVAVIKSLEEKGLVRIETRQVDEFSRDLFIELEEQRPIHLTSEQQLALQRI